MKNGLGHHVNGTVLFYGGVKSISDVVESFTLGVAYGREAERKLGEWGFV
jgi:hypothetical protein